MNVTINRAEMLCAIKRASAIAPADSPLDVLRGVLLEADAAAGKLTVTSTNLEAALEEKLPCTVQEDGALVFGAKMLAEMLSRLPQDTVQLCRTENQGRMTLRSGDACYEVDVWERGAFPKPDLPFPEDTVKLSGIPAMAQHTVFATAQDNSKPLLKCVNLMFTSTGLRAAGSNGNCIVTARGDNQSTGDVSLLIPAASLGKLSNMCQDKDEFRVGTTGKSIVFFRENFLFSARLMEGGYIDTDQLVGSIRNAFTVLTDIHDMRAALSSVLSIGTGNRVKLSFQDQRLVFQCAGDCVSASAPIEVIALTGAPAGDYPTLKEVCEGRELPAYEAAAEFAAQTSGELDDLLSQLGGKPGAVQTLEKLEQAEKTAEDKLAALLEQLRGTPQDDPALSAAVVKAANDAESKRRQADAVNKLVDAGLAQNQAEAGALIARAVSAAAERAEEVQTILGAWSDAPGDMRKTDANAALLERVRDSKTLRDISRYLGRFREIFAQGKRNGYAYGRGEKYALELGNDLSRALTSELAMLAVPETLPLFLRKYQHRQIKQYRRREPVYKGAGDIICCLDESGSTAGDLAAWGKAVAMTLLEIAQSEGRKFALVHFSGPGRFQTDVFLPRQSSLEEKLHAAETFLGGGTDFQTPLAEAERLMREGGFENADIAFITDGECSLPETCVEMLQKAQSELRFTVTGILLDEGNAGMDFSLKTFCQNIYRTSELTGDQIVREIVLDRV